jgi:glucose-1-phosphate cytidylyltransferase
MKCVIFAGGYGSRLGELTSQFPKPMIEIGGKPILYHIMNTYSYYGINEFILCLGYKANIIKDYFIHFNEYNNDFTIDYNYSKNNIELEYKNKWKVSCIDTGIHTLKASRLMLIKNYLTDDTNLLTYGDGLADININELVNYHNKNKKILTITGVHPPARFGELDIENDTLSSIEEKSCNVKNYINGGYMVFDKKIFDYLPLKNLKEYNNDDKLYDLEYGVFKSLHNNNNIAIYKHEGKWACIDNERDIGKLNKMYRNNEAFWKV